MIVYSPVNDKLKLVGLAFAKPFDELLNSLFNLCSRIIAEQPARFRHVGECLRHVARLRRLTVNLGVLDGKDTLYLDVLESAHEFRLVSEIGMRRPLNCTALGKAILAHLPAEQREEVFSLLTFERFTRHTVPDLPRLKKELAKVRQQGHALDEQETVLGARCVAAPIMDASGKVAAAISVSGPITRITREKILSIAGTVKQGAQAISALLGYSVGNPHG